VHIVCGVTSRNVPRAVPVYFDRTKLNDPLSFLSYEDLKHKCDGCPAFMGTHVLFYLGLAKVGCC